MENSVATRQEIGLFLDTEIPNFILELEDMILSISPVNLKTSTGKAGPILCQPIQQLSRHENSGTEAPAETVALSP